MRLELVVTLLEKSSPYPRKYNYNRLFNMLRFRYPIAVLESSGAMKRVVFLKRHRGLWMSFYELTGWKSMDEYEVDMKDFMESHPDSLFPVRVEVAMKEYATVPAILRGEKVYYETRFHELLKSSEIMALAVRGTCREVLLREVTRILKSLLYKGVVPVDYSYNYIIVVRKKLNGKWWLSAFGYDPINVLKWLESRPAIVLLTQEKIERIVFENRDIGWGLNVIEKY